MLPSNFVTTHLQKVLYRCSDSFISTYLLIYYLYFISDIVNSKIKSYPQIKTQTKLLHCASLLFI